MTLLILKLKGVNVMKLLTIICSLLMFGTPAAFAGYGTEDGSADDSEKSTAYGTEVEVEEFILLDAMPHIELAYYPYSATDADVANSEDVPGGAGSVFVGGGEIKWHANIDTTLSIDDFTLTNIDTGVTARNEIAPAALFVDLNDTHVNGSTNVAALDFDGTSGSTVASMSADMTTAYALAADAPSQEFDTDQGHTDFATKFYIRIQLADSGSVQGAGTYRGNATVRTAATVSE
jgi:hypothetical protein